MIFKAFTFLLFMLFATTSWGQHNNLKDCDDNNYVLDSQTLTKANINLPIYKKYCYSDNSGNYVLYLSEKKDKIFHDEVLSTTIEAHLLKINTDHSFITQWSIRDFSDPDEAGLNFRSKLIEIKDIDNDGLVEPILVYRFFNKNGDTINTDDFSGRIKIIMFYKGKKVAIRAVTGSLDDERETIASNSFFSLPKSVKKFLINKMADMYKEGIFGFDNTYGFMPTKVKSK